MPAAPTTGAVPTSVCPNQAIKRPVLAQQALTHPKMAPAVNSMNLTQLSPPPSTSVASILTALTTLRLWCLLVDVCMLDTSPHYDL